jgi:hypothetical protein
MKKHALRLLGALTLAVTLTACYPFGNPPVWTGNAETDVDAGGWDGEDTLCMGKEVSSGLPITDRLSIVDDPLGELGKVYHAYLTADDIADDNKRAEFSEAYRSCDGGNEVDLYGPDAPPDSGSFEGPNVLWVGWHSLFGSGVALEGDDNDGNYVQLKGAGTTDCGGPAVGLTISNNHLIIRTIDGDYTAWTDPVTLDQRFGAWQRFEMKVHFAKDDTGYVELYVNGEQQVMQNGEPRIYLPTVCEFDTRVYPKFGVYNMDSGDPAHWFDEPKIAYTRDGLDL